MPDKKNMETAPKGQGQMQDQNSNQDLYDIFVAQGIKLAAATAQKIQGNASIDTLGNALADIVNKIEAEGTKNGIRFGIDVLLHGSNEILGHLLEMSKVQVEEPQIKFIIGIAVGKYIQNAVKTGKMTAEQVQQIAQQAQQSMPEGNQTNGGSPMPAAPINQGLLGGGAVKEGMS